MEVEEILEQAEEVEESEKRSDVDSDSDSSDYDEETADRMGEEEVDNSWNDALHPAQISPPMTAAAQAIAKVKIESKLKKTLKEMIAELKAFKKQEEADFGKVKSDQPFYNFSTSKSSDSLVQEVMIALYKIAKEMT